MSSGTGRTALAIGTLGNSEIMRKGAELSFKGVDELTGAKKAREQAKAAGDKQLAEMKALENEAVTRKQNEESSTANAAAQRQARTNQQKLTSRNIGRSGTILTSPLGVTSSGRSGAKTILGG